MHGTLVQFLKFAGAGAVGTVFHYATLILWVEVLDLPIVATAGAAINTGIVALLYGAEAHYLIAQAVATMAVLAWNFIANRHWTFAD